MLTNMAPLKVIEYNHPFFPPENLYFYLLSVPLSPFPHIFTLSNEFSIMSLFLSQKVSKKYSIDSESRQCIMQLIIKSAG